MEKSPVAAPQLLAGLSALLSDPVQIVIATKDKLQEPLIKVIREIYLPDKVILCADGSGGQDWLIQHIPALRGMELINGKSAAYVCRHFACELPVTSPEELRKRLSS
ncbi:MAG: hypothetical protein JO333_11240 [Verrucomicrobia bacterium]|nr:hypothetical protein [Verrucomicrobiota bacterium]